MAWKQLMATLSFWYIRSSARYLISPLSRRRIRFTPRSNPGFAISYGPHIATAFFASAPNFRVSLRLKFLPGDTGHLFFDAKMRAPGPSKTHRFGFSMKSAGSQLMVNASNSQSLYSRVGNSGVSLAGLFVANTRITVMNECDFSG